MKLAMRTQIGPYEILSPLGAGGMGEVYRARDTRLEREVAIKVLPTDFAKDADRLRRFEQEARATSALNHPNILTVYDIGNYENAPFIVAELLEGEELREQLNEGALPVRTAIEYAQQIAGGLAAAHEKGITHRDLKPENLFVTKDGRIKILDFGLAKLKVAKVAFGAGSEIATQRALTDPGAIMGTVGYMSPEQVRGHDSDHRSDIFSFGAILYEMLSGRRAFQHETMAETMTAILKEEPDDFVGTNTRVHPALERIVQRCLEKKPERRFQSTSDLGFALEALSAPSSSSGNNLTSTANALIEGRAKPSAWRSRIWMMATFVVSLIALALGLAYFNRPSSEARAARLSFTAPPNLLFNDTQASQVVISPNGQKIAFTATLADGKTQLWVRPLDSLDAQPLPGSDDAIEPFWSTDSRSIAFGSQGKLKRVDLSGGAAQILCDAARMTGGSWNSKGVIVFGSDFGSALFQVPATGGEPKPVTIRDTERGIPQHSNPVFLPDGKHFLFKIGENTTAPSGVWVGSLDSQEVKQVLPDNTNVAYALPGWLVFVRNQALVAQAFDAGSLELKGDAIPIAAKTATKEGTYLFSVSDSGVLVWQEQWQRDYQLVWFDREGKQTGAVGAQMKVTGGQEPNLSPDGKRLVTKREGNIWVIDLAREIPVRLTSVFAQVPIWSPDGSRVAYSTRLDVGGPGIVQKAASGVGEEEMLLKGVNFANDWSPDGRFILFIRRGEKTRGDVWVLPLSGDRQEYQLLNSAFDERNVQFSPNGRWLAYASDESGSYEIYVRSFTADGRVGGDKKRISSNGGMQPKWRGDGQELFYIADDGQMMSVAVKTGGPEFEDGTAKALFKTRMLARSRLFHEYDVTADGQRFLIGTLIGESKATPPTVILNWTADLKK
jgi:serine/threonine protein kinase